MTPSDEFKVYARKRRGDATMSLTLSITPKHSLLTGLPGAALASASTADIGTCPHLLKRHGLALGATRTGSTTSLPPSHCRCLGPRPARRSGSSTDLLLDLDNVLV